MEKLDPHRSLNPYYGGPSKHESWDAWATLSLEHINPMIVVHPDDAVPAE